MKRIGIIASRISRGDLVLYNCSVVVISFLLSLLIFFLSSFSVLIGLALVSYLTKGFMIIEPGKGLSSFLTIAVVALAVFVGLVNIVAILINIKLRKSYGHK